MDDIEQTAFLGELEVFSDSLLPQDVDMLLNNNDVTTVMQSLTDGDLMWQQDVPFAEEVIIELEIVPPFDENSNDNNDNNDADNNGDDVGDSINLLDISNAIGSPEESSDYGSEVSSEPPSDMDLSHGSLDLSRTGPYYSQQSRHQQTQKQQQQQQQQHQPLRNGYHSSISLNSFENVSEASTPDLQVESECLDLRQVRVNKSPRSRAYMHYSGGTSVELSPNGSNLLDPNFFQYQLPRIKLEPGLGIDPTITYKPEMDLNHNKPVTSSPLPGTTAISFSAHNPPLIPAADSIYSRIQNNEHLHNGCDKLVCDKFQSPRVAVETLNSSINCIPLTVTSPDDENDSGTESIDSKDSDASNNLCISESGKTVKQSSDKKRPGRKKGQVSKVYHLWEFIRDVLNDPNHCGKVIKWENEEEGIFRVVQSEVAASMWGQKKKNRTKMTYEKMSRSIRYSRKEGYFDDLPKDKGYPKKLCFKFGKKAHGWNTKRKLPTCVPLTKLDP
ncbi:hypothetical protein ACF0H5_015467 [Mactra antiquata]